MSTVNEKMTAIADEIRELSGTTGTMGLDAMASTLNAENTNFASNLTTQDNLISQIQTALQNKAAATGEDVTSETTAYTNKLATLETAITALETELQGKASGGSVETCTITFSCSNSVKSAWITKWVDGESIYYYIGELEGKNMETIEVTKNSLIAVNYPQSDSDYLYYHVLFDQGCKVEYEYITQVDYPLYIGCITDNTTVYIVSEYDE